MQVITVKEFMQQQGFASVASVIRTNTNGYPYITFIDKDNKAENVYFSKNAAKNVAAGEVITRDTVTKHQIGFTTNSAGDTRIKLISNSERLSVADLFD